jgi:hypothetical protein
MAESPTTERFLAELDDPMKELAHKVATALESDEYDWRTLGGIAKDTGLEPHAIEKALSALTPILVQSESRDGLPVFTTREHYQERRSLGSRFLTGLSGELR